MAGTWTIFTFFIQILNIYKLSLRTSMRFSTPNWGYLSTPKTDHHQRPPWCAVCGLPSVLWPHSLIRGKTLLRMERHWRKKQKTGPKQLITSTELAQTKAAMLGHLTHADTYYLRQHLFCSHQPQVKPDCATLHSPTSCISFGFKETNVGLSSCSANQKWDLRTKRLNWTLHPTPTTGSIMVRRQTTLVVVGVPIKSNTMRNQFKHHWLQTLRNFCSAPLNILFLVVAVMGLVTGTYLSFHYVFPRSLRSMIPTTSGHLPPPQLVTTPTTPAWSPLMLLVLIPSLALTSCPIPILVAI